MYNIIKFIKRKIIKPIHSTYLCIRYPFLYPRNRFTGLHYTNWKLHQYHVDNWPKAVNSLFVHYSNLKDLDEKRKNEKLELTIDGYFYKITDGIITLYYWGKKIGTIDIYKITESYSGICRIGFYKTNSSYINFVIVFDNDTTIGGSHIQFINHVVNKWLYFKIKFADFLQNYVLQVLHCIPTFTEIDVMKSECPGWYKRFGRQLLKDMNLQLKKDKMLYSFRITQIKEKWGRFQLYCGTASQEMYDLINRYGDMSEHICIDCGRDADIITSPYGWMCPYCNDCYEKYYKNEIIAYRKNDNGEWIEEMTEE